MTNTNDELSVQSHVRKRSWDGMWHTTPRAHSPFVIRHSSFTSKSL